MIRRILVCLCSFASLLTVGCGRSGDSAAQGNTLASLADAERTAIEALLKEAGLNGNQLRPVGRLGIGKNPLSIVVEGGHVRGLRISNSPLKSMLPVAALPEIEILWLPNNGISEIAGLDGATKLTQLVLSGNQIHTVRGLSSANALETLSLDNNHIDSLTGFPWLGALHTIDLTGNLLASLDGLAVLPKLWTVRAVGNPLTSAEAVRVVRTRGGVLELPESVAALSHGVNAPRPDGESPSTFVMALPAIKGTKIGQENFHASRTGQVFEYTGRMKSLTGTASLGLVEGTNSSADPVTIEMKVATGRLRVYLADLHGFRYVEVRPQQTARLSGRLMLGLNYYALLQAMDGEVSGLEWRVYRKQP